MKRVLPVLFAAVVLAAALPSHVAGAINGPLPYEAEYMVPEGISEGVFAISGALNGDLPAQRGGFGMLDVQAVTIDGLTKVCYERETRRDPCSRGDLSLRVLPGGSFGFALGTPVDADLQAAHAVGLFGDFSSIGPQGVELGTSLLTSLVSGTVNLYVPALVKDGVLVTLSEATRVQVIEGGEVTATIGGDETPIVIDGRPQFSPIEVRTAVLPFTGDSALRFTEADPAAAEEGLRTERLNELSQALGGDGSTPVDGLEALEGILGDVLNGAIIGTPVTPSGSDDFVLVRFDEVTASPGQHDTITFAGEAPLQIQGQKIAGSKPLIGIGYLALPWWSVALWIVGGVLLVARIITQPPKKHERWDRYKWAGWLAGPISMLVIFWLWDREVYAIWGTSLLHFEGGNTSMAMVAAIQLAPLGYGLFAVAGPVRLILQNGLLLARQGSFMKLSSATANAAAFIPATLLMFTYLELFVGQVASQLSP